MKDLVNDGFRNVVKPYIDREDKKSREIIAPVEVSPAEAAHSIGDQIVYNGILYNVTAAIAIGDALATSGTGENISAADDITTQIKNHTVTTDATPTKDSTNPVQSGGVYTSEQNIFAVMGANGAKNLLPFDLDVIKSLNTGGTWAGNVYTYRGVTFTVNADGTVSASGTASGGNASIKVFAAVADYKVIGKTVIMNGTPAGGSSSTYSIQGYRLGTADGSGATYFDYGNGVEFTWLNNASGTVGTIGIVVYENYEAVDLLFKPMIRLASDTDDTYQPYAETNKELTDKAAGLWDNMTDNGSVNVLHCSATSQTKGGISFVVNDDGTITANNTATGTDYLTIVRNADEFYIGAGTWKLTGCPSGGNGAFSLKLYNGSGVVIGEDTGNGLIFTLATSTKILMQLTYTSGYAFSNHVFKPMISLASLNLSYDDYVPYAKTNKELTDDLANMGLVSATPNKTTFNITYQGGKSGDMALVITSVGLGSLNFYASAWHWGGFIIASGTTITESNNSANGLTLTASGNIGLFLLPLNTEGDKWAITTN